MCEERGRAGKEGGRGRGVCESVGVTREAGVERQPHVHNNLISPPCPFCGAGYVIY